MKYEKRVNSDGSYYYSFVDYVSPEKPGEKAKRSRIPREEIKKRFGHDVKSEEEAKECVKLLEALNHSKVSRIEKRLAWENKYYNFKGLVDQYELRQKKKAPNSYQNNVFYLKHYVLKFFLEIKKLRSAELWSDYYEDFRVWLENDARQVKNWFFSLNLSYIICKQILIFRRLFWASNLRKCASFASY